MPPCLPVAMDDPGSVGGLLIISSGLSMSLGVVRANAGQAGGRFDVADPVDVVEMNGYFCHLMIPVGFVADGIVDAAYV